jgi:hypothetical protein
MGNIAQCCRAQALLSRRSLERAYLPAGPAGTNVLDFADFQRRRGRAIRIEEPHIQHLPTPAYSRPNLIDIFAAAFIAMSVAFGPMMMWVLTRPT